MQDNWKYTMDKEECAAVLALLKKFCAAMDDVVERRVLANLMRKLEVTKR